ncbi:putative pectinesterase 29, partial [Ananas comosus]
FLLLFASIFIAASSRTLNGSGNVVKSIFVNRTGKGDFRRIQEAINSIPDNNDQWIRIHVAAGVYKEKVLITQYKGFILLEGEGAHKTLIKWGDYNNDKSNHTTVSSATFSSYATNFVARDISFKNTYNGGSTMSQAVAALIAGDSSSFYRCSFIGIQDTLCDAWGRHYYEDCYIEGALDFIFGQAQSMYQRCTITTVNAPISPAYVTAQGRSSDVDQSGFVFKSCTVNGTVETYLGRAWRNYARVIFYDTNMSNIVAPLGWDAWNYKGKEKYITFVESGCSGPGSNTTGRVKWKKTLSSSELNKLIDMSYINGGGWLQLQPNTDSQHKA